MLSPGPVFDAYVMVDWSAESRPKTGPDSIWIAIRDHDGVETVQNPPTRDHAMAVLADILSDYAARGRHVLVGFDFALGLPRGAMTRLGCKDWRSLWRRLRSLVGDSADNANSRFAAAAQLNQQLSGGAGPFWGCPANATGPNLTEKKADFAGLPERRLVETRLPRTKPVWQLHYNGAVGSQSLLGMARLDGLRHHPWLTELTRVWPFETGLKPMAKDSDWRVLLAEVYPSLLAVQPGVGEVKDRAQVLALARHFAKLDEDGRLAEHFAGDQSLTEDERLSVETEEGWILGAGNPQKIDIHDWIKDPDQIYRNSFATIGAEVDLDSVPADMRDLMVRVIHACGMTDIAADLSFSEGAAAAGTLALSGGAPILVDAEMVSHGIIRRRLPKNNPVICTLNDPAVPGTAKALGTTRSAMAVDLWLPHLDGAVVAIGNAPTALFRLLELMEQGAPRPAVVLGFPVGFVGAAESKEALIQSGLPYVALRGRRGGSAMAAAAVNALSGGLS